MCKESGSTWLEIENEWTDEQFNLWCIMFSERQTAIGEAHSIHRGDRSQAADMIFGAGGGNSSRSSCTIWDLPKNGAAQYPNMKSSKGIQDGN